ncbi:Stonustoxin subunit alpha, partial [Stegodyphus mimosarum]
MASAIMMYVLPMMLGQTYDLGKEKPGLQIYLESVEENSVKIEHHFTDSQYRTVENAGEIKDFLDISGKLSLKIKSGVVDIGGEGSYLKDSSSKSNGIEILVKVHFETVTKTIPTSLKPNAGWSLMNKKYLGTHYCRSITYGGDLVASIRISSSNRYDLERIKGAINGGVKTKGGSFTMDVKGKLEKLKNDAQDSSSMEINYYASVPIHGVSYDIDGLMKLINDFPNQVKRVNGGLGNPLRMELYPLSSLQEDLPVYYENRALADELEDLEEQFDDLRETKQNLGVWMSDLPPVIPTNVQKKIETFIEKINTIFGVYLKTIANLDIAEGASTQPIQDAFNSYKDFEYIMPQKYIRKFRLLQK